MGIIILSTRFHLLVECVGVFRIAVMFYIPLVGGYPIAVMFYAPLLLYSHCGLNPSGVCVNFSVYGSFPMWYCVCKCINTKTLPTDFHWSMGSGAYPTLCIVGYGGMSVCRHCVSICFAYIIIIQSGGGKSNKKMCFNIF